METWLREVRIQNFKSIREASFNCERINLFVGRPNAGKSNLLEALALLQSKYLNWGGLGFGKLLIRYEQAADLFYDQNFLDETIRIDAKPFGAITITNRNSQFIYSVRARQGDSNSAAFGPDGRINDWKIINSNKFFIGKKYHFPETQKFNSNDQSLFLLPPHGENLINVLQINKKLRKEAASMFEVYGLELLVDSQFSRLEVAKRRDGILFKTPFSLVADTLRRYLFHVAAIESNRDSVILFEEPESHNYPPYIQLLAQRIMEEKTNQYFITTHSPFLFNALVEEAKDVAVFVVEYEDFQTKVRRLSEENLREILDYGLNIFTEQELFA